MFDCPFAPVDELLSQTNPCTVYIRSGSLQFSYSCDLLTHVCRHIQQTKSGHNLYLSLERSHPRLGMSRFLELTGTGWAQLFCERLHIFEFNMCTQCNSVVAVFRYWIIPPSLTTFGFCATLPISINLVYMSHLWSVTFTNKFYIH